MALSTKEAPVYGGSTLVIEFSEDTVLAPDACFYLVYEGSQQRHVTTARRMTPCKLHSIIPGHHQAEQVQLSALCYHGDNKNLLTTSPFHFHNDGAFFLAQFLVDSVYSTVSLEDLELIKSEHFDLADEELSTLDQRLSRALAYLHFPDWWSILGPDPQKENREPRETVLHFAARLGLNRVAAFLIRKPGCHEALGLSNRNGDLPKDVALANGNNGLAELLSDFSSQTLMPLGRWIETEKGVVQTQETGDVTLTSKLQNHHRTIEEDIIVLQGVQQQLEDKDTVTDTDISRQWQAEWPAETGTQLDANYDNSESTDEHFMSICKKAQELPGLVTLETVSDFRDDSDTYTDPNLERSQTSDDVDFIEDRDEVMDTESLPKLHVSEGEDEIENIMEDSISGLHEYNEHLLRIREKSTVFNRILEQDLRKETLARFSSSCPSLDADLRNSPLPVIDEADHHKSMVDLAEDNDQTEDTETATPSSLCSGNDLYSSGNDLEGSTGNVHIIVEGSTLESSSDFGLQTREYDDFLKEYYGGNVPQVRHRSHSPQSMKGREGADEQNRTGSPSMLIHGNKSVSLTPSEGDETDDDSFRDVSASDSNVSASDSNLSAGTDGGKRVVRSTGDIEEMVIEEQGTQQDSDASPIKDSPGDKVSRKGRGHKARFSADIEYMMRQSKERHSGSSLDKMASSDTGATEEGKGILNLPHAKMTKALSTSSIPAATNADRHRGSGMKGLSHDSKQMSAPSYLLIQKLIAEHDAQFHRQDEIEEEDTPESTPERVQQSSGLGARRTRKKADMTLLDFLNDPGNFSSESTSIPSPKVKDIKDRDKEEKKRKTSVFSRFHSSYRKKNKEKEGKNKTSHRFLSISVSNAATCDMCHKPLINKPALRCEICLVNVHDNSCKEQITPCDKFRLRGHPPRQSSADSEAGFTEKQSSMGVSALRPSSSFKDKSSRTQSAFVGAATQPLPISTSPLAQPEIQQLQTASSQLQRRSLPTPSRAIAEEGENADNASVLRLDLGHSNITETNSHSIESLDEVDSVQEVRFDDVELGNLDTDEPETWSETADKKILKKMPPKDIKRQDTIWELIQTERLYCKRLKTLQIFFHDGMLHELHWPIKLVERMFPHLDDLIYIHMNFLQQLQDLQNKRADRGVDELGATLKEQFSGESAEQMKSAYGAFCSGHLDAVQLYKDQIAKDRKFQNFIKARSNHHLCKKREIPDFILLITQRTTKYPILIEAIIKSTKDKKDRENLSKALEMSKGVLKSVDETVSAAERRMRLRDIYHRLDSRSWAQHRGKKFKKQDLTAGGRKLLHEGVVSWKNARGKSVDVLAVVLTDVLFFLQENNQKYSFFSQDNKNGVVSLFNLLVREKRDTRDTKGIYLISQNKQSPEMYEIVFNIMSDMQKWAKILRLAVEQCPEEEDEVPTEAEEERRKMEEKVEKAQVIMEKLRSKDEEIRACCDSKNKLMIELLAVYNDTEEQHNSRPNSLDFEETSTAENSGTLQAAIQEVSNAASQLTSMLQGTGTNLSRSVSSVGEHNSHTFTVVPIPKRAETFAGFDNSHDTHRVASKKSNEDVADFSESPQGGYRGQELSESDLIQYGDITPNSYPKGFEGEADSGCGSSLGGFSSASTLSPMSSVSASQEQSNVAHLLRTLNSIVHLTASQGTAVETLRAQLAEANERINKLSVDVHEKKSGYRHNQLEELRNLQGVIQKEKEEWEVKKEKETYAMEHERLHLEEMRKSLEKQESDLKQHKEEFNKKREVLQLQMDMLRKTGQLPRGTALMGATSSESDTDKADNVVQATADFVPSHKRSASAESFNASNDQTKTTGSSAATSNKDQSSRSEQRPTVSKQSFSFGHKQNLPIHLLSAKNEQKVGSKNVQKIPSKLLSSSATGSQSTSSLQTVTQPGLRNTSPSGGGQGGSQGNGGNQSIPANLHEAGTGHVDSKLGHSSSAGSIGNHANSGKGQQPGTSVTVPKGNWQSNRPSKPGSSAGISALLKLSEKGDKKDKKGSSSSQGGARSTHPKNEKQAHQQPKSGVQGEQNTNSNHKSQKSESDVIYF